MGKIMDLTGQRFDRLVVLEFDCIRNKHTYWKCQCDCGNIKIIEGSHLKNEHTKSCGCLQKEINTIRSIKHGMYKQQEYKIWYGIIQRCYNPKNKSSKYYYNKGIMVCNEWLIFENFYRDMGKRPGKEYSIDRLDGKIGYSKENCRWATRKEQNRNQSSNKIKSIKEADVIRYLYENTNMTQKEIGCILNISRACIQQVTSNSTWM